MNRNIVVGSDYGGLQLKKHIVDHLILNGFAVEDIGTFSAGNCDYKVFENTVAERIKKGEFIKGILLCSTWKRGFNTYNMCPYICAELCWNLKIEESTKLLNDSNLLCLPVMKIANGEALEIVSSFLATL